MLSAIQPLSPLTTGGGAIASLIPNALWRYDGVTFEGTGRYENDQSKTCSGTDLNREV